MAIKNPSRSSLPSHLEVLRNQLFHQEKLLTEAMHALSEAVLKVKEARIAYAKAFNEYMSAHTDRRKT